MSGGPAAITRRDVLKLAATALLPQGTLRPERVKKIIVAGAGIGGLSCAWELVRRGHDVTVVEASARTGGHVFTFRAGLVSAADWAPGVGAFCPGAPQVAGKTVTLVGTKVNNLGQTIPGDQGAIYNLATVA